MFPEIALASQFGSIFHTTDADFSGTPWQTTVGGGSVALSQSFICGTSTVSYNGYAYPSVPIGTQCWLAENLLTTQKPDGSGLSSYCYSPCGSPWGRLYTWNVAMNGATTATACGAKIQGICPAGWHIPSAKVGCSNDDWYLIQTYLGDGSAYGSIKTPGTTYWNPPNSGADTGSGFNAVGAGYWYPNVYVNRLDFSEFWTSFEYNVTYAYRRILAYNTTGLNVQYNNEKIFGFSVRCMKDTPGPDYYSTGTYYSPIFQRAQVASWGNLTYNAILYGQGLGIKVRSCALADCSGGDDWGTCSYITSGNALLTGGCVDNSEKYIQYIADFSSDGSNTAYLNDITVDYQYNPDTTTMWGSVKFFGTIIFK